MPIVQKGFTGVEIHKGHQPYKALKALKGLGLIKPAMTPFAPSPVSWASFTPGRITRKARRTRER